MIHHNNNSSTTTELETIVRALGGYRVGRGWVARCPAHKDRHPSLSISQADRRLLVYCHAGCSQRTVIAALQLLGLWRKAFKPDVFSLGIRALEKSTLPSRQHRSSLARTLWDQSTEATHTLVKTYLASRGIMSSPPSVLRFHNNLRHPSGEYWPAMIAEVSQPLGVIPVAVHRTFLARDGYRKANVQPQRMMLGPTRGAVVRLADPDDLLMVGEGIETCLAAMEATGYPAWAALSVSGLRALELPGHCRNIIILADGDAPGEAAARESAFRWKSEGRRVRIARAPKGMDFNDLLLHSTHRSEEGAI